MQTVDIKYYLTTFECRHHRPKLVMKFNSPKNVGEVAKHLMCPTCGQLGGMKMIEQAQQPSYSVPTTF